MPELSLSYNDVKDLLTDEWSDVIQMVDSGANDHPGEEQKEKREQAKENKEPMPKEDQNEKRVALTYDDGPHPENTVKIMKLLEEYEAKATFYLLGSRVDFYPEIAKQIAAAGHEIGNHSWSHKDLTTLGKDDIVEEIEKNGKSDREGNGRKCSYVPSTLWSDQR